MTIQIDPEFKALIPPLSAEERAGLEENIKAHGCRVPLDVWDGLLVDGHNRFEICTRLGVPFETKAITFADRRAARMWIIRNQFDRRNLDVLTRCELAAAYEAEEAAAAKERQATSTGGANPQLKENLPEAGNGVQTRDRVGALAGVSGKTYEKSKAVSAWAVPELKQAVRDGRVSISAAAEIVHLPKTKQREIALNEEVKPHVIATELRHQRMIEKRAHVENNSGNNEWYTPKPFIDAARATMGSIDTDPASCEFANKTVKAKRFFSVVDNGLKQKWAGNVWLNPPYAQPLIGQFAEAVAAKFESKEIAQAIVLVNNATETTFFQRMMESCSAICFPKARVKFLDTAGNATGAPLQGQAILYFGANQKRFAAEFAQFGKVVYCHDV